MSILTVLGLTQLGASGLKYILDNNKAKRVAKHNEQAAAMANAQSALSSLGNAPRQFAPNLKEFKPSSFSNFLGGVGQAAGIGQQLIGLQQAAADRALRNKALEGQIANQDLQRAAGRQALATAQSQAQEGFGDRLFRAGIKPNTPIPARVEQSYSQNFQPGQTTTTTLQASAPPSVLAGFNTAQRGQQAEDFSQQLLKDNAALQNSKFGLDVLEFNVKLQSLGQGGLDPTQVAGIEKGLRGDFLKLSSNYRTIRDSYSRILATAKDPSAAGDLALIFNYMKMLDPNSVVRESEFATAENAGSVPEAIRNKYNRVLNGERLGETRGDFLKQAKNLFTSATTQIQTTVQEFEGIAQRLQVDPRNVTVGLGSVDDLPPLKDINAEINRRLGLGEIPFLRYIGNIR